jgi:hypothetical protein
MRRRLEKAARKRCYGSQRSELQRNVGFRSDGGRAPFEAAAQGRDSRSSTRTRGSKSTVVAIKSAAAASVTTEVAPKTTVVAHKVHGCGTQRPRLWHSKTTVVAPKSTVVATKSTVVARPLKTHGSKYKAGFKSRSHQVSLGYPCSPTLVAIERPVVPSGGHRR